jgi:hypothetical protein
MKVKEDYVTRKIADEIVIVPTGEAAARFSGMITVNETAAFIWEQLQEETTEDEIIRNIQTEFEVDKETAANDVHGFLEVLRREGMIEE